MFILRFLIFGLAIIFRKQDELYKQIYQHKNVEQEDNSNDY